MTGPVHFRAGDELGVEPVVHFRAKLLATISNRGSHTREHIMTYSNPDILLFLFDSCAVVQFSDKTGKDFFLYL